MGNSILLDMTSKEEDQVPCDICGEGVYIPSHPEFEVNHSFYCNKCGAIINLDGNVTVE